MKTVQNVKIGADNVAWITDPHINFICNVNDSVRQMGSYLQQELNCDTLIITGDISEGNRIIADVTELHNGWVSKGGKNTFFVTGNHDYYRSSWNKLDSDLAFLNGTIGGPVCLNGCNVIIDDKTAIVGNSGWYDADCGNPYKLGMSDWSLVEEYAQTGGMKDLIIETSRAHANVQNVQLITRVQELYNSGIRKITLLTHIPPWREAAWHMNSYSDDTWAPWMTNLQLGRMLCAIVDQLPELNVQVLCGHTHSSGKYQPHPRIVCLTGRADYGNVVISGFVTL